MDFPAWLGNNTAPSDNVIVQMDLGDGREFEMLSLRFEKLEVQLGGT